MNEIQYVRQHDSMECGISCLSMVCKKFDKEYDTSELYKICKATKEGVSLKAITETARSIGLDSVSVQITLDDLMSNKLCSILHWNQNHFVVLYKVNHKKEYFFKTDKSGWILFKIEDDSN